MLLPIINSNSRDSSLSDSTTVPGTRQDKVFSGQCKQGTQPFSSLAVGRWLLVTEALRPQADSGGISVKRKELVWDDDKLLKLIIAA